jgi:hypothetical protein
MTNVLKGRERDKGDVSTNEETLVASRRWEREGTESSEPLTGTNIGDIVVLHPLACSTIRLFKPPSLWGLVTAP